MACSRENFTLPLTLSHPTKNSNNCCTITKQLKILTSSTAMNRFIWSTRQTEMAHRLSETAVMSHYTPLTRLKQTPTKNTFLLLVFSIHCQEILPIKNCRCSWRFILMQFTCYQSRMYWINVTFYYLFTVLSTIWFCSHVTVYRIPEANHRTEKLKIRAISITYLFQNIMKTLEILQIFFYTFVERSERLL